MTRCPEGWLSPKPTRPRPGWNHSARPIRNTDTHTLNTMSATRPKYCLYHANCPDGFAAAWVVWLDYGDAATYIPVSYGKPLPEIPDGADVFIVDFSYPRDVLEALAARCQIHVIDHHVTAAEALKGFPHATFDLKKSGAVLTWEHLFPTRDVPELLLYVQDRDLWQWQLPASKEINAGLWRGTPRDFNAWKFLRVQWDRGVTTAKDRLISAGEAIAHSDALTIETLTAHPHRMQILSYEVPAVNTPVLQSEIGHRLLELHPHAPFAAMWWSLDGGSIAYSLRARAGDFDVSQVAKEFGGGGHRAAAGFSTAALFEIAKKEAPAKP